MNTKPTPYNGNPNVEQQIGQLTSREREVLQFVAEGKLTTFPGKSEYQMVCDKLEPAGAGGEVAEGQRQAAILTAEGSKQSQILNAEGDRESQILRAQADREASILRAQGEGQAIQTVFQAIHDGNPDPKLLAYQYLQTLPEIAQGPASKLWIVPSELTEDDVMVAVVV